MARSRSKSRDFQNSQIDALNRLSSAIEMIINDNVGSKSHHTSQDIGLRYERELHDKKIKLAESSESIFYKLKKSSIDREIQSIDKYIEALESARGNTKEVTKVIDDYTRSEVKRTQATEATSKLLSSLSSHLKNLGVVVKDTTNRFTQISNDMIAITGASGDAIRSLRKDIVTDSIRSINRQTDDYFDPEKSYQKIAEAVSAGQVGNVDAIREMSRPILLASESMNLNLGNLSKLFGRWYNKYNFSSSNMETMLDNIRKNTAGNNATEEAVLQNIETFKNITGTYSMSPEDIDAMNNAIISMSSRAEAGGVSSSYAIDFLKNIAMGELPDAASVILAREAGYDYKSMQNALRYGDEAVKESAMQTTLDALITIADRYKNDTFSAEEFRRLGFDPEQMFQTSAGNVLSTSEFKDSIKKNQSMVESIDDKFSGWGERIYNRVKEISEFLARLQETNSFGLGISDSVSLGVGLATLFRVLRLNGGRGILNTIGSSLRGGAGFLGANAAKFGGIGLGAGLAIDGGMGLFDSTSSTGSRVASSVELAGGLVGGGALAASLAGVAVAPWLAPVALAVGGGAALYKLWEKNTTSMSGNAEKVAEDLDSIGESLKKENRSRLESISDLSYQLSQTNDVEEQRKLIAESGLVSTEQLQRTADENLKSLVDSYKNAALSMDDVTDQILKKVSDKYKEKADIEQTQFIDTIANLSSDTERANALNMLKSGISNQKTLDKIDSYIKYVNNPSYDQEQADLLLNQALYGYRLPFGLGKKNSLSSQEISTDIMRMTSGLIGSDQTFTNMSDATLEAQLLQELYAVNNREDFERVKSKIKDSGLEIDQTIIDSVDKSLSNRGLREGTNYNPVDHKTMIHEGESVVPKKYNPAANVTELEMLRDYYKNNSNEEYQTMINSFKEFSSTLKEIKDFLSYWRDDNIRRETTNISRNRFALASQRISQFDLNN